MLICPHCHKAVDEFVEVFNKPIGCVCDHTDWIDKYNIPPIRKSFEPDPYDTDQCKNCEHLLECHST